MEIYTELVVNEDCEKNNYERNIGHLACCSGMEWSLGDGSGRRSAYIQDRTFGNNRVPRLLASFGKAGVQEIVACPLCGEKVTTKKVREVKANGKYIDEDYF